MTLCLLRSLTASGSHAKYSKTCEGTSTRSAAHRVPDRCWYSVRDNTLCMACPSSCMNVSTSECVRRVESNDPPGEPKLHTNATEGNVRSDESSPSTPSPRGPTRVFIFFFETLLEHRTTKCAACGNFPGRGATSR